MKESEILFIESIITQLNQNLLALKYYIGERKGENKAYDVNRSQLKLHFQKSVESTNQGDTLMQYKGVKIRKRRDNRWEARWQINNISYSVYGATQQICYEKLKKNYSKYKPKKNICNRKLHEWLDYFLVTYKAENKSKENDIAVRLHIKPNMENKPLNKVTPNDVQELMSKLKDKSRTRITVYNVLNEAFRCALINKYIKENPCEFIKRPKHTRETGNALTKEEELIFLDNIKGHASEPILLFLLHSGMRRNEALTMRWEDIDWKNNQLHVKGTKTEKSNRIIPIFKKLKELLLSFDVQEQGNIFNYKNPCSITRSFIRLSGLPNHKLHDLRHTFATRCIEQGIPMKYVQCWLGHSSYKTTADIYSHVNSDNLEQDFAKKI